VLIAINDFRSSSPIDFADVDSARLLMQGGLLLGIGSMLAGQILFGVVILVVGVVSSYLVSGGRDLN
jgi:hypothetical protein